MQIKRTFYIYLFSLILTFLGLPTFAQDNFGSEKELKSKASKHFEKEEYSQCLQQYSQLLSLYPKDAEYNYRYGVCLLMAGKEKEKSIVYLVNAAKSPETEKEVFYFLGKAYHLNYQFDEAIANYNQYKSKAGDKAILKLDVNRQIEMCKNGKDLLKSVTEISVIQKNQFPQNDYFRAYNFGNTGIRVIVKPEDLKSPIDKKRNEASVIAIHPMNPFIYFSSYGTEDKGHKDIYRVAKSDNLRWEKAQHMGDVVNSKYDDEFPFIGSDGKTLFFSSKGHNSMGGFDIFKCTYDSSRQIFTEPVNLDFAINTPDDDLLFITDSKIDYAYFASRRSTDANNISVFKIKKDRIPGKVIYVKGVLFATEATNHPNSKILIKNEDNTKLISTINTASKTGSFSALLRQGTTYTYIVETPGYLTQTKKVTIPENLTNKPLLQTVSYTKKAGEELLTIESKYDDAATPEAIAAATMEMFKNMASLDINASESATSSKPTVSKSAETSKSKEFPNLTVEHQKILRDENNEFEKLDKQTKSAKKEVDDFEFLVTQREDSANFYRQQKGGNAKRKAESFEIQANELKAQLEESKIAYQAKKTAAENQKKYIETLESKAEQGNNESFAEVTKNKTNILAGNASTAKTEAPKQVLSAEEEKQKKADDIQKQIDGLKTDLASVNEQTQRNAVQKQIDQLTEERNNLLGIKTPEKTPVAVNSTKPAGIPNKEPETIESMSAQLQQLNAKISATKNPTEKNKLNRDAEILTAKLNSAKIESISKSYSTNLDKIASNSRNIVEKQNYIDDNPLKPQLEQENRTFQMDAENLKKQADIEKNSGQRVKKLEQAESLQQKIIANQDRLISEINAKEKAYLEANAKNIKEAEQSEKKAEELLSSLEKIETSKNKDLATAKDLRSYAESLKNKSKKRDAEMAAEDYEKSAAKKQTRIDSINTAASQLKQFAFEKRNPDKVKKETSSETSKNNAEAATKANENNNIAVTNAKEEPKKEITSSNTSSTEIKAIEEIQALRIELNNNKQLANQYRNDGNKKVENVLLMLEEAQENKSKNARKDAEIQAVVMDKEGRKLIKMADSLDALVLSRTTYMKQKETEFENLIAKQPAAEQNKYRELLSSKATENKSKAEEQTNSQLAVNNNSTVQENKTSTPANATKQETNAAQTTERNTIPEQSTTKQNETQKTSSPENTIVENKSSENSINANSTVQNNNNVESSSTEEEYKKLEFEAQELKSQISKLTELGNKKINEVMVLLENEQESGNKSSRKNAEIQAVILDKEGRTLLKTADSLNIQLTLKNKKLDELKAINPLLAAENKKETVTQLNQPEKENKTNENVNNKIQDTKKEETKTENPNTINTTQKQEVPSNNAIAKTQEAEKNITANNPPKKAEITPEKQPESKNVKTNSSEENKKEVNTPANNSSVQNENKTAAKTIESAHTKTNTSNEKQVTQNQENKSTVSNNNQPKEVTVFKKYRDYMPGDKVEGLKYTAEELRQIVESKEFQQFYNMRQSGDSINYVYSKYLKKAQQAADTSKKYLLDAADNMETADNSKGEQRKKYLQIAKQKEDSSKLYLQRADKEYAVAKGLANELKKKDDETVKFIAKLDNRTAGNYQTIYDQIAKIDFETNEFITMKVEEKYQMAMTNKEEQKQNRDAKKLDEQNKQKTATTQNNINLNNQQGKNTPEKRATLEKITPKFATNLTNNQVYYDLPEPDGIVFKVQVGAFKRKIDAETFGGLYPVFGETSVAGLIRYYAGIFQNYNEANEAKRIISDLGFADCFVVAYCNGRKITVNQARDLIATKKDCDGNTLRVDPIFSKPTAPLAKTDDNINIKQGSEELQQILKEQNNLRNYTQLLYTVQVGVFKNLIRTSYFGNLSPLYYDSLANGNIRYSVGIYNNRKDANDAKNIINKNIPDAFVIPLFNRKRISIEEADALERERGNQVLVAGNEVNKMPNAQSENNISNNANLSADKSDVFIKVQIGAFRKDVPVETMNVFLSLASKGIDIIKSDDGITMYCIGKFKNFQDAYQLKQEAQNAGIKDAFIVGFIKDKKVTADEALEILNR